MCSKLAIPFAILAVASLHLIEGKKFPSFVKPCKRTSPTFNECYAKAIENLKPYMAKGVPELGIPPCKPLVIPRLELKQPEGANVGFDAVLTNLTFTGTDDFVVKRMEVDIDKGTFVLDMHFNRLKMLSDYRAIGKVLIVQFEGEGLAHGDFGNIDFHANWQAKRVMKKGKEHFKVIKDSSTLEVRDISLILDNLFKNNQALTDNTNRLINENADVLSTEVKPIIERTVIDLITSVVNYVNEGYSIDELYPA